MDGRHFDEMTKKLALGTSRRNVLRGLIGGGAAIAGLKIAGPAAAQAGKTVICHVPPGNPGNVQKISVGNPSLTAHLAHGDSIYGGCCTDSDCAAMTGACGVLVGCLIDDDNVSACVYQTDNSYCADACGDLECCEGYCADSFICAVRGKPGAECNDGNACTSNDRCGDEAGECAGTAFSCGTNTECLSWGCNPSTGCYASPNFGSPCQDGSGTCDASGVCVPK